MSRFDYDSAERGNRRSPDAPANPYWPDPADTTPAAPASPGAGYPAPSHAGGGTSAARPVGDRYDDEYDRYDDGYDRYGDEDRYAHAGPADADRPAASPYAGEGRHSGDRYAHPGRDDDGPYTGGYDQHRYAGDRDTTGDRDAVDDRYPDDDAYAGNDRYADGAAATDDDPYGGGHRPGESPADLPAGTPEGGKRRRGRRRAGPGRPPTVPSRAGRNLPAAIGVGVALVAVALVPLFVFTPGFVAVVAVAVGVGCWELQRAIRTSGATAPLAPLLAGTALMMGLAWRSGADALSLGLLVTVLGVMIWRLGDGPAGYQRDVTAATLIATYVPFLGGFAVLLALPPDGAWRVLVTLAAVVLSDTGGYAAGVKFGKHPMAPTVSPKKSWEGLAGSLTASALGSALLLWLCLDVAPWWGGLFGVAIATVSVLGDLSESLIKRDLGVKDMSNLLPGHGGVMDRLDSILFAAPTAYLLLLLLAPVG